MFKEVPVDDSTMRL